MKFPTVDGIYPSRKNQFLYSHKSAHSDLRPFPCFRRNLPIGAVGVERNFFFAPLRDGEFNSICTHPFNFCIALEKLVSYCKMRFFAYRSFCLKYSHNSTLSWFKFREPGMQSRSSSSVKQIFSPYPKIELSSFPKTHRSIGREIFRRCRSIVNRARSRNQ